MSLALARQELQAAINRLEGALARLDETDVPYRVVKDILYEAGENIRAARNEVRWSGKKWERLKASETQDV